MDYPLIPVLGIVAFAAAWSWFFLYRTGRHMRTPVSLACSGTLAGSGFLVTGALGDPLSWWNVGVGLTLLTLAALFWRRGIQEGLASASPADPPR